MGLISKYASIMNILQNAHYALFYFMQFCSLGTEVFESFRNELIHKQQIQGAKTNFCKHNGLMTHCDLCAITQICAVKVKTIHTTTQPTTKQKNEIVGVVLVLVNNPTTPVMITTGSILGNLGSCVLFATVFPPNYTKYER